MGRDVRRRFHFPFYLIPVVIGMAGVLFSRQFDDPLLRGAVVLVSLALPLFASGAMFARLHVSRRERALLVGGIMLLVVGAAVMLSGFADSLIEAREIPPAVGELSRWLGVASLVTGLIAVLFIVVRTDEAIEEVGGRFRQLARHMSEGFVLSSADGRIATVNQRFLEMTGLEEHEIIGLGMQELANRVAMDRVPPQADDIHSAPAEYQISWTVDGQLREFWVSSTPVYGRRGQLAGALATVRDITEQNRLARSIERYTEDLQRLVEERTRQLRQSEQQLRDLLENMNEGFLTVDHEFRIRFSNTRISELLGAPTDAIRGEDVFKYVEAASHGKLLDLFSIADSDHKGRVNQELNLLGAGHEPIPVMVGVAPIREHNEEHLRYSLVVTDVSELKAMQRQLELRANELELANQELRMLDRAKDTFLSNVTHELRTPLSTIRGYIEMLQGEEHPNNGNALRVMERNVDRLQALIEEMIEFSRMQIRGVQLSLTLFDITGLVEENLSSIHPQASEKDIHTSHAFDADSVLVWGDSGKLGQALTILLSNAVKFTEPGGEIRVEVKRTPDNGVSVAVSDTGIGIDEANQERVFDKFYQVDSDLNRRYEGAGIGLSIAKSIVQGHGSELELDSALGEGSTFRFHLPGACFRVAGETVSNDTLLSTTGIYCGEPGPVRDELTNVLDECGMDIIMAANVFEAIRRAREHSPDVMIVDNDQPLTGGETALQRIRQEPDLATTPIMVFGRLHSGEETPDDVLPPNAYWMRKPFTASDFVSRVANAYLEEPESAPRQSSSASLPSAAGPRVLVVDSDSDFLTFVETAFRLRRIPCRTTMPSSALEREIAEYQPDVIIGDIDAEAGEEPHMLRALQERAGNGTPAYAVTAMPKTSVAAPGAVGTLRKPFSVDELVTAVMDAASHKETGQE